MRNKRENTEYYYKIYNNDNNNDVNRRLQLLIRVIWRMKGLPHLFKLIWLIKGGLCLRKLMRVTKKDKLV